METREVPKRISRRTALQWVIGAASLLSARGLVEAQSTSSLPLSSARGYGLDPSMVTVYKPGDVWPLTLTDSQRALTAALCDVIVPASAGWPSASTVAVPEFIDEWISAPYPDQIKDRPLVLDGLGWVDAEAQKQFGRSFATLTSEEQNGLCERLADSTRAKTIHVKAGAFFKRFRDLTFGAYCTTPEGMKAVGYIGNVPLASYPGPSAEALRHLGLE